MDTGLQKLALDYVASAQPVIDAFTEQRKAYQTKAAALAPLFVEQGLVAPANLARFQEKLASDPSVALEYLEKVARMAGSTDLGAPASSEISTPAKLDAFESWAFHGDPGVRSR